jgi:hypothetical protein
MQGTERHYVFTAEERRTRRNTEKHRGSFASCCVMRGLCQFGRSREHAGLPQIEHMPRMSFHSGSAQEMFQVLLHPVDVHELGRRISLVLM